MAEDACGAKEVSFADMQVDAGQVHATIMGALDGTYAKVVTTGAYLAGKTLRWPRRGSGARAFPLFSESRECSISLFLRNSGRKTGSHFS